MLSIISVDKLLEALPLVGYGVVGVFAVTAVIILVVTLLNKFTQPKDKNKKK